jgi:hypothetical protein
VEIRSLRFAVQLPDQKLLTFCSVPNLLFPQDFGDVIYSFFQVTAIGTEWHVEYFSGLLLRRRGMDVGVSERVILVRHPGRCL